MIEATKFAFHQVMHRHPNMMALPKVKMIQLVGEWKDNRTGKIMEQVFRHNQRMLIPHGIESVAISQPPTDFMDTFPDNQADHMQPPFWKMGIMHEQCQENDVDLLWYLDGDTLIMDPHARVEFLWLYHSHLNQLQHQHQHLDMLFAHDWYGFNAGIILVNCTSQSAMLTLKVWQDAAVQLLTTYKDQAPELDCWYEQKSLHFMLNTWQWNNIPANQSLHWDNYIRNHDDNNSLDADSFSSESLTRRIRHTASQCALNNSPPPRRTQSFSENDKTSMSPATTASANTGPFIVHMAGLKGEQKNLFLDHYRQIESWSNTNLTWQEAAISYLRNHPFSYTDRELVFRGVYEK